LFVIHVFSALNHCSDLTLADPHDPANIQQRAQTKRLLKSGQNSRAKSKRSRLWIVSILRIVAGLRKGTEMGSDYALPMHSRRVSLLEKPGKRVRSQGGTLSTSADLAYHA